MPGQFLKKVELIDLEIFFMKSSIRLVYSSEFLGESIGYDKSELPVNFRN